MNLCSLPIPLEVFLLRVIEKGFVTSYCFPHDAGLLIVQRRYVCVRYVMHEEQPVLNSCRNDWLFVGNCESSDTQIVKYLYASGGVSSGTRNVSPGVMGTFYGFY